MNRRVLCVRILSKNPLPPRAGRPAPEPPRAPGAPAVSVGQLRKLARWCRRYSPLGGLAEAELLDTLALDVTGCTHLFGGEARMARVLLDDLRRLGWTACAAMVDTLGAAWAVAHTRPPGAHVIASGDHLEAIKPLRVE